jgi:hypothetical protein
MRSLEQSRPACGPSGAVRADRVVLIRAWAADVPPFRRTGVIADYVVATDPSISWRDRVDEPFGDR